jgi:hypothetical protein
MVLLQITHQIILQWNTMGITQKIIRANGASATLNICLQALLSLEPHLSP